MLFQIRVVLGYHMNFQTHCNDSAASEVRCPQVTNHWCNSHHLSQGVPLSIICLGSLSSVLPFEIFIQFCKGLSILFYVNTIFSSFLARSSLKYKTLSYYKNSSYMAPSLFPLHKRRQSAKSLECLSLKQAQLYVAVRYKNVSDRLVLISFSFPEYKGYASHYNITYTYTENNLYLVFYERLFHYLKKKTNQFRRRLGSQATCAERGCLVIIALGLFLNL